MRCPQRIEKGHRSLVVALTLCRWLSDTPFPNPLSRRLLKCRQFSMRILLATSAPYVPTRGGATRANRAWLERIASHGHATLVVAPQLDLSDDSKRRQYELELRAEGISKPRTASNENLFLNGVEVSETLPAMNAAAHLESAINDFQPDWVLVSSEDFGQARLRAALRVAPKETIYLAHTPQFFPFGPDSLNPSPPGSRAVCACASVVVIGEYTKNICQNSLNISPLVAHPPVYGRGPFANFGARHNDFITMINPCGIKGIAIFESAASACNSQRFAALPGWGTTPEDLMRLSNSRIEILPPCRNIDELLQRTRLLLVPSLWSEGFGLVVIEAMLRGIPVLASNLGGLVEAKQNTRYMFSVNAIKRYLPNRDAQFLPIAEVPEQNPREWIDAINELSIDSDSYEKASFEARQAALRFLDRLDPDLLETTLSKLRGNQTCQCC